MSVGHSENFENECLDAHNLYRARHGCPPLTLNQQLTDTANKWAQVLIQRNIMEHSIDNKYGENIYMAQGLTVKGDMPVKSWYDEVEDYNFEESKFTPNTGHFTQVIWKNSKELGVGIAHKGNLTFVVANYRPAGNFIGRFKENVPIMLSLAKPRNSEIVDERPDTSFSSAKTLRMSAVSKNSTMQDEIPNTAPCSVKTLRMLALKNKERFRSECLEAHNRFRELHGVQPLELDDELTNFATSWAQALAKLGKLRHSTTEEYGENIYMSEGIRVSGEAPVKIWYDEIFEYSFEAAKFSAASGGFTQIVWKDTKKLGVGIVKKGRVIIVVATYSPPGNVVGLFKENVLPVGGSKEIENENLSQGEDDALQEPGRKRKSLDDEYYDASSPLSNKRDNGLWDYDDNGPTIPSKKRESYKQNS